MRRYTERDHRAPLTTTIIEDLRKNPPTAIVTSTQHHTAREKLAPTQSQ
jgi:hypothetical protein